MDDATDVAPSTPNPGVPLTTSHCDTPPPSEDMLAWPGSRSDPFVLCTGDASAAAPSSTSDLGILSDEPLPPEEATSSSCPPSDPFVLGADGGADANPRIPDVRVYPNDPLAAAGAPRPSEGFLLLVPGGHPVPDYELVHRLGRGGCGEVWKALGPGGVAVALKFIPLGDRAAVAEQRGLDLMKNLRHAHLLGCCGIWRREGYLILALELADGTLLDRLRQALHQGQPGIPRPELLEYLREAAKGIDYLNGLGIQHRDIKPHNLLLVGGCAKVADFGLATLLQHAVTSTAGVPTVAYAAPEFFQGLASSHSDQYSLAVTYCQLRSGQLPFAGTAHQVTLGHILAAPDLRMLPPEERSTVARALAKDPGERWPSCRALVAALADATPTAHPQVACLGALPQLPSVPRRGPRAARWRMALSCSLMLAMTSCLVFGLPSAAGPAERATEVSAVATTAPADPVGTLALLAPARVPSLRLPLLLHSAVQANATRVIEVPVEPADLPVRLEIGASPDWLRVETVTPAPEGGAGQLRITAGAEAPEGTYRVLLRAWQGARVAESVLVIDVLARPALYLRHAAALVLEPGGRAFREVRIERQRCPGPVRLEVDGVGAGLRVGPVTIPPGADTARLEVEALPGAAPGIVYTLRLRARHGAVEASRGLLVGIKARAAATTRPLIEPLRR